MNVLRKSLLSVAVSAALIATACSSSNNTATATTGSSDVTTVSGTGVLNLPEAYPDLLLALAGYQLESLNEEVMLIGDAVSAVEAGSPLVDVGSFTIEDRGEVITIVNEGAAYDCESGGSVTIEQGRLRIGESSYSRNVDLDRYQFEQCQLSGGTQQLDGSVYSYTDSTSGSRFTRNSSVVTYGAFSWNRPDGSTISADANMVGNGLSSFDSNFSRSATINQYAMTNGNSTVQKISNGQFEQSTATMASGGIQVYALAVSGRVENESGIPVMISSQPALFRVWVSPSLDSGDTLPEPFTGEIDLSAENGSQLVLTATEPGDTSTLQVDVFYRTLEGSTTTQRAQNFQMIDANI